MLAELRTISLCDSDSDLFMQTYNALHRKSSDSSHSAAVSYYSGTESQQSVSDRSFYDNIAVDCYDHHTHHHHPNNNSDHRRNYLMPPMKNSLKCNNPHVNVNRSVSFQETCVQPRTRTFLTPRTTNIVIRRRNLNDVNSSSIQTDIDSNRSSVSPSFCGSAPSTTKINVDCSNVTFKSDVQNYDNYDRRYNGPFYLKLLRRMQKFSSFWRKRQAKKDRRRGRFLNISYISITLFFFD